MITVTESAAKKILSNLEKRGKGLGVRFGIKTTGCSGLAYTVDYVDTAISTDTNFISNGVQIFVDQKSLPYLEGVAVDWVRNGLNERFDFKNPLEKARCGCGESFHV